MSKTNKNQGKEDLAKFPYQVFNKEVQRLITEVAESVNCPVDFAGIGVLSALAIAVGNFTSIRVKKGWNEKAILFILMIGDSGVKKTPAFKLTCSPIFLTLKENWKKFLEPEPVEGDDQKEPEEKVFNQLVTTNTTIEALAEILRQNPHGVLLFQDEAIGWVKSMNQYKGGSGNDMEQYLSAWSNSPIIINRKSEKQPTLIDSPFIVVTGGIQNDILPELGNIKENGFVYRILYTIPNKLPFRHSDAEIDDKTMEDYFKLIRNIYTKMSRLAEKDRELELTFNAKAKELWVAWHKKHIEEMNDPDMPYYLIGAWSKLEAYSARFSLIMEHHRLGLSDKLPTEITEESVKGGIALTEYFKAHARRTFGLFYSSDLDRQVDKAYQWIRKRGGKATVRQFASNRVAGLRYRDDIMELFEELHRRGLGYVEITTPPTGGHKTYVFRIKGFYDQEKGGAA